MLDFPLAVFRGKFEHSWNQMKSKWILSGHRITRNPRCNIEPVIPVNESSNHSALYMKSVTIMIMAYFKHVFSVNSFCVHWNRWNLRQKSHNIPNCLKNNSQLPLYMRAQCTLYATRSRFKMLRRQVRKKKMRSHLCIIYMKHTIATIQSERRKKQTSTKNKGEYQLKMCRHFRYSGNFCSSLGFFFFILFDNFEFHSF